MERNMMNCPYCDNKMIKGFISGAPPVFFSQDDKIYFRSIPREGEITLKDNYAVAKAYQCEACKKLVLDYNELENYCGNIFLLFLEE